MGTQVGKGDRPNGQKEAARRSVDALGLETGVFRAVFLEVAMAAGASGVCGSLQSLVGAKMGVEAWIGNASSCESSSFSCSWSPWMLGGFGGRERRFGCF